MITSTRLPEGVTWVTLRFRSFEDGKRLFLSSSIPNPGWTLIEFQAPDHSLRVGEIPTRSKEAFLGLLEEGNITTAFELCEGVWIINPERETDLAGLFPGLPAEACTELGV